MSASKRGASPPTSPPSKRFGSPSKRFGSPSTPISPTLGSGSSARFEWLDRIGPHQTVLHVKYDDPIPSSKVACFDFVGTLVVPISFNKYCQSATDWKWLESENGKSRDGSDWDEIPRVVLKLRELYENGYGIVIFSSTTLDDDYFDDFETIVQAALTDLDVPLHAFFSTGYDVYRSPCVGMWLEYEKEWNRGRKINLKESFFVSHASGVGRLDYARKFALNVNLPFQTPDAFFYEENLDAPWSLQGWNPKKYAHSEWLYMPTSTPLIPRQFSEFDDPVADVVFLIGPPASGKTSFYYRHFEKHGYERITSNDVNQLWAKLRTNPAQDLYVLDMNLPSRAARSVFVRLFKRCPDASAPSSAAGSVVVPSSRWGEPQTRFMVRCLEFVVTEEVCKHNSQFAELWDRRGGTPEGGEREFTPGDNFVEWRLSFQAPNLFEGFDEIKRVEFKFDDGWPTKAKGAERFKQWGKYGDCYKKDWMTRK